MPPQSSKGPWQLPVAGIGGLPSTSLDAPITAVFLFLFVLGAITHMTILQVNLRRGKKFIISGMIFGFCMARITAATLRLVWSTHHQSVPIAIAANIFMAAGVILLFVINLIFTQRVLRATHPQWTWTKWFSLAFKLYYASIVIMLIALIIGTVQSFYTLSHNTRRIDRTIQLVGSTYFAVGAFLPIPLIVLNIILPKQSRVEKFGEGRFRTKIYILLFCSFILTFGAAFRAGVGYVPRPRDNPAWYHSKAVFYIINFGIEITVVALYAIIRVDKRFHVPNGAKGPGDYTGTKAEKVDVEGRTSFGNRILDEEEVFDGEQQGEKGWEQKDVEASAASSTTTSPR
jgi:hypothetical protein